jgi:gamma-glutamyl phosphate reductase
MGVDSAGVFKFVNASTRFVDGFAMGSVLRWGSALDGSTRADLLDLKGW